MRAVDARDVVLASSAVVALHLLLILARPRSFCGMSSDLAIRHAVLAMGAVGVAGIFFMACRKWRWLEGRWQRLAVLVAVLAPIGSYAMLYRLGFEVHILGCA